MKAFQNFKTGVKLFLGFGLLIVAIVIVAVVSYFYLSQSNNDLSNTYEGGVLATGYIDEMNEAMQVIRGDTYKYLILTNVQDRKAIREEITSYTNQFTQSFDKYVPTLDTQEEKDAFAGAQQQWADYQKASTNVLSFTDAGNQESALQSMKDGEFHLARVALQGTLSQSKAAKIACNQTDYTANEQQFSQATWIMGVITLISVLVAILGGYFIGRSIVVPLSRVALVAQGIATGQMDLSSQVDVHSNEEVGAVAAAFNAMTARLREILDQERRQTEYLQKTIDDYSIMMSQVSTGDLSVRLSLHANGRGDNDPLLILGRNLNEMISNLARMIAQIREASNNLTSAAAEILAATTQQASGASEQSSSIAQTTTTVDEVKTIGEQAVLRAQEVVDASNRTVQVSRDGMHLVSETIDSMSLIKERVEGIAENILSLSEQTQLIGEIITTVSDIASQSNMLALNASVEAARAGEHGKGFAVVAAEVRSLAEQSRQATVQVKGILQDIQKATNNTVMATEEGTKVVDRGANLVARTQESIEQLSEVINESAQRATQVMAGGRQQTSGVEQIAVAMQNINTAMIQSLGSTRQAERAAQNLNDLAHVLNEMVKQYAVN